MPANPRVLMLDIETVHNVIAKFDLREEYTAHQNILVERYIVCASWKWLGEKRTSAVSVLNDRKRYQKASHDDYHVVKTLRDVMQDADVLIGHNIRKFDLRWINGRMLFHGMQPLPPITTVDTLTVARSVFYLNSNRLAYLGGYLGLGGKADTKTGLWLEVLKAGASAPKAIRDMVAYNKRDVELLEAVYNKLHPFIPDVFNRQLYVEGDGCPRCGVEGQMQRRGVHRALTRTYQRYACGSCGGWSRAPKADKKAITRRSL